MFESLRRRLRSFTGDSSEAEENKNLAQQTSMLAKEEKSSAAAGSATNEEDGGGSAIESASDGEINEEFEGKSSMKNQSASKRIRFGSEKPDQQQPIQEDGIFAGDLKEDEKNDASDDEAPESVSAAAATDASRAAAARVSNAHAAQRAEEKDKRRRRMQQLEAQSEAAGKNKKRKMIEHEPEEDDAAVKEGEGSESDEDDRADLDGGKPIKKKGQYPKKSKTSTLPMDLLDNESLFADKDKHQTIDLDAVSKATKFEDDNEDERQLARKLKEQGKKSRLIPKNVRKGPVTVKVLGEDKTKVMAPRSGGASRNARDKWLARNRKAATGASGRGVNERRLRK